MSAERACLVVCVLLAGCMPTRTRPMELGLDAYAGAISGDDIGHPLGAGARLALGPLALSMSQGFGDDDGHGVICVGLVPPEDPDCVPQEIEQDSEILRFGAGYLVPRDFGRHRLAFTPYLGGAYLAHEERGLQTGGTRDAAAGAWQLGARVAFERNLVADLWLGLAADAALIMPIRLECADCYDPFRESLTLGTLALSATWRVR